VVPRRAASVRQLKRDLMRHLGGRRVVTVAERLLIAEAAKKVVICEGMGELAPTRTPGRGWGHAARHRLVPRRRTKPRRESSCASVRWQPSCPRSAFRRRHVRGRTPGPR
jgi:hypothetical protein